MAVFWDQQSLLHTMYFSHIFFFFFCFSVTFCEDLSAGNCGFGHIYWKNPQWKTSLFVQCYFNLGHHSLSRLEALNLESLSKGGLGRTDLYFLFAKIRWVLIRLYFSFLSNWHFTPILLLNILLERIFVISISNKSRIHESMFLQNRFFLKIKRYQRSLTFIFSEWILKDPQTSDQIWFSFLKKNIETSVLQVHVVSSSIFLACN